jgi:dihydroflavonol-4-reductase
MKAFVTGSTGLLGSNLVNTLVASGYEVQALARSREKAKKLFDHSKVEIVMGDLENIPSFATQLAGSDVLFHTAAYVHEVFKPGNHWPKLEKLNIHATVELLHQAEKHGVKKVIHTSTTSVLGIAPNGMPSDEQTPPDDFSRNDLYSKSKLLAEQAIEEFQKNLDVSIVRILPSGILGPQDSGPSTPGQAIVQILERKFPIIPPGGFGIVDVRDVAEAMIRAVEHGRAGERYIISNRYVSLSELVEIVGRVSGVKTPTQQVPYSVLNVAAHISELTSRITGIPPMLSVNALKTINRKQEVSADKAIRELGLTFRPFDETIRDTIAWFLSNGYVRSAAPTPIPA